MARELETARPPLEGRDDAAPRREVTGSVRHTILGLTGAISHLDGPRLRGFAAFFALLLMAFSVPLYNLARFAWHSDIFSHVLLVPAISLWMIAMRHQSLVVGLRTSWLPASILGIAGIIALAVRFGAASPAGAVGLETGLALITVSFLAFASAGGFLFLGAGFMRVVQFPLAFLLFMAPFPAAMLNAAEVFLQHASAEAAYVLISLTGLPVLREGVYFKLPGLLLEVAPECSGIRSTLVLFITSVFAGNMLLRNPWHRVLLASAVVPLAILRNGARILTLAWLSVKVDPEIIHSPLHSRGGPIFFALSLVPFGLLLVALKRKEMRSLSRDGMVVTAC